MRTALKLFPITAAAVAAMFGAQDLSAQFAFRNEGTIEFLQQQLVDLEARARNIQAAADADKRQLSIEEQKDVDALFAQFEAVQDDIARRERVKDMTNRLAAPNQQRVEPVVDESAANADEPAQAAARTTPAAGVRKVAPMYAEARRTDPGKWGFRNAGDYVLAVKNASARGAVPDPRLIANANPTTYGSEGVGADGGFAVPPDFRATIVKKVMGEQSLLSMTDQNTTSSNNITVPVDETTPWQSSGGIQVYWESEAGLKGQSKPQLKEISVKANKLICLVPMTDELLEDAPAMTSWLTNKVPDHIDYAVNQVILRGTGVGQPLGILAHGGLITVPAESGQAADTVVYNNIVNMYTRMVDASKRNAVWLLNGDIEAQLMKMSFPGSGTAVPAYLPPGGLSAAPYGQLMGRPALPMEACSAIGDVGDIIFADMAKYMSLVKGGLKTDVSIHLWFDYDLTAFRFVLRFGGRPWFNAPITRANGSTRGFFVTLAAR